MKQINFGQWFRTESKEKISYVIRDGGNYLHDFVYFGSYINDAECFIKQIKLKNGIMTIPIERARWEIFDGTNLLTINSIITVSNVSDYFFHFPKEIFALDSLEIRDFYPDNDTGNIVIANNVTRFKIIIIIKKNKEAIISLKDI